MRKSTQYIATLFLLLIVLFAIGKGVFVVYNSDVEAITASQFIRVWLHGLMLDVRTAAIVLLPVAACLTFLRKGLRWALVSYLVLLGIALGVIIAADIVMYEFWEFKFSAVHLSYAASPEGTTNSVSIGFLLTRFLLVLLFTCIFAVPAIIVTPKSIGRGRHYWLLILLAIISIMPVGVRNCYHRGTLFMSHAATNPVFRFDASFSDNKTFVADSREAEIADSITVEELYASDSELTDTLLNTQRPNVLFVMMESFGGKFVEELGGIPGVAPNLSRLIPEGIFWDNYYSNSFRTDRGTVCAYSGWISYPTISPMKEKWTHPHINSLALDFRSAGYQAGYLYGGAMTNMGKHDYLIDMGFEALMDEQYFTRDELNSSWGANDSTAAMKLFHTVAEITPEAQWMMVWQTLSSHEPWDVPYHRLENEQLNAFAYTDQCVGELIDSLRTLPVWDKLLVIIIPDHGFLFEQTFDESEFFHSPMLWTGGAIRQPKRMSMLMNQSDIAATLLTQMGLPHSGYVWSRNVLSPNYKPFVYCNYPTGLLFKDETGETMYDLSAQTTIPVGQPADSLRLSKGLSILRHSYREMLRYKP